MKTVWSNQANGGERRYMTMINREKFPWFLPVLNLLVDLESWWVFETCSILTATWEIVQLDYRFSLGWNHQLDHCSPRYIVRLKTLIINTTWFFETYLKHIQMFSVSLFPQIILNFQLDAACCVRLCVCVSGSSTRLALTDCYSIFNSATTSVKFPDWKSFEEILNQICHCDSSILK